MEQHVQRIWDALLAMQRLSWEQGLTALAARDLGRYEVAELIARDAIRHASPDGRLGATGDATYVNGGSLLEAVHALAATGDASAQVALEAQRWWFLRYSPRDDSGVVWHVDGEVWADSVFMVVPALALTHDFAPADLQYRMHREHLWNPDTGLYGHKHNTVTGVQVRPQPWASGNGWVAAGIARALHLGGEAVPAEMKSRWQRNTSDLLGAVLAYESADGRLHDVLDDPTTFVDGTAGLMFAYAALTGVCDAWLDAAYADHGKRWLEASLARTGEDGVLREVCGAPHFDKQGASAEAQAFALMAIAAAQRLELN